MPDALPGTHFDKQFPDYAYAARALVKVFDDRSKGKEVATLFLGEWMRVMDEPISTANRIHVRYRGGKDTSSLRI